MIEPLQFVASRGYDADRKAADEGRIVVLHEWNDGFLLAMYFDDEMPSFTGKPPTREEADAIVRLAIEDADRREEWMGPKVYPPELTATGYVFAVCKLSAEGRIAFNGRRYSQVEIQDYVLWGNDSDVKSKYLSLVEEAKKHA